MWVVGTLTFSAKRSNPHAVGDTVRRYAVGMQYAVGVSAKKVNPHSGLRKYGWWGSLPLVQKGQTPHSGRCSMQYAVSVSAKRSTYTVDLANTGGGDCYLQSKKVKPHAMGYAVLSRCWCKKVNSHSGLSKYGWWGPLPLVQKGQTHAVGYAACSRYAIGVGAKRVNFHSGLSKYATKYCVLCTYCVLHTPLHGFDLFSLKVMVPTTRIC